MQNLSDTATRIVAHLQAALAALDDLKSQPERTAIYDVIAAHLRSASPMSFHAPAPVALDTPDLLIDLGAGSLIRLRMIDEKLTLYVGESGAHDAAVTLTDGQRAQLAAALGAGGR